VRIVPGSAFIVNTGPEMNFKKKTLSGLPSGGSDRVKKKMNILLCKNLEIDLYRHILVEFDLGFVIAQFLD
jgi:hypothetical protein